MRLQIQYIQVSRCMFQQGGLDSSHDSLVKAGHRIYNAPQILPVPGLSPMCCSGGWRICMGGSSFLSPAEENYGPQGPDETSRLVSIKKYGKLRCIRVLGKLYYNPRYSEVTVTTSTFNLSSPTHYNNTLPRRGQN